ncbi:MAG TPA: bifunctional chorismate mutase/prephenate dehydratase [Clostridiales bacterium]|nr:bifunctional chorismate mutase/prephenate dehydratase [Clostridiales bacterium]
MEELQNLRTKLDKIDKQLTSDYVKRMEVCSEIGKIKKQTSKNVEDISREEKVLYNVLSDVKDELKPYVKEVYKTIFSTSKAYQREVSQTDGEFVKKIKEAIKNEKSDLEMTATVACQGVEGANSHTAVKKFIQVPSVSFFKNFDGVFSAVDKGFCKYGVLPIENSTAGSVLEVYDLITKHNFYIVKSLKLKIEHCLASVHGASLESVKKVTSHAQALRQCSEFIKANKLSEEESSNTGVSAKLVAESNDTSLATICSPECAELYGLKILKRNIQNQSNNYTRFILIAKDLIVLKGSDKVSIVVSLAHKVGSLSELLNKFSLAGLNLTKIESRPQNSDFEFLFYLDFSGDITSEKVLRLLNELEYSSQYFEFLGSYKEII